MAVAGLAGPIAGEVAGLLGGTGVGSAIARGALSGLGAVAAVDLLNALQADLGSGNSNAVATARRVPQYAIVDLHNNKTVRFLSAHKVYVLLTTKRRRSKARSPRIITVPRGSELVEVK